MGYKCCVSGCKSGYATTEASSDRKISFFSFPHDHKLREKWIKNCHRENFTPTKFSRVRSLHFIDKDFAACEKQRKLLPTTWPMVHQNLPTYLEKIRPTARTTTSSSSSRLQKENSIILRQTLNPFNAVKVDNLNDIKTK